MICCASTIEANLVHVQTLVSQSAVTRFTEGVFHGFAGPNNVELHATTTGPIFERPRLEFGAMIHCDGFRGRDANQCPISGLPDGCAGHSTPPSSTGLWRLQLSTTVKIRNGRPSARLSCTKSMLQRSVGPTGTGAGPRCNAICFRRRTRMRSCNPSSR
jgi:hypothetical protein